MLHIERLCKSKCFEKSFAQHSPLDCIDRVWYIAGHVFICSRYTVYCLDAHGISSNEVENEEVTNPEMWIYFSDNCQVVDVLVENWLSHKVVIVAFSDGVLQVWQYKQITGSCSGWEHFASASLINTLHTESLINTLHTESNVCKAVVCSMKCHAESNSLLWLNTSDGTVFHLWRATYAINDEGDLAVQHPLVLLTDVPYMLIFPLHCCLILWPRDCSQLFYFKYWPKSSTLEVHDLHTYNTPLKTYLYKGSAFSLTQLSHDLHQTAKVTSEDILLAADCHQFAVYIIKCRAKQVLALSDGQVRNFTLHCSQDITQATLSFHLIHSLYIVLGQHIISFDVFNGLPMKQYSLPSLITGMYVHKDSLVLWSTQDIYLLQQGVDLTMRLSCDTKNQHLQSGCQHQALAALLSNLEDSALTDKDSLQCLPTGPLMQTALLQWLRDNLPTGSYHYNKLVEARDWSPLVHSQPNHWLGNALCNFWTLEQQRADKLDCIQVPANTPKDLDQGNCQINNCLRSLDDIVTTDRTDWLINFHLLKELYRQQMCSEMWNYLSIVPGSKEDLSKEQKFLLHKLFDDSTPSNHCMVPCLALPVLGSICVHIFNNEPEHLIWFLNLCKQANIAEDCPFTLENIILSRLRIELCSKKLFGLDVIAELAILCRSPTRAALALASLLDLGHLERARLKELMSLAACTLNLAELLVMLKYLMERCLSYNNCAYLQYILPFIPKQVRFPDLLEIITKSLPLPDKSASLFCDDDSSSMAMKNFKRFFLTTK